MKNQIMQMMEELNPNEKVVINYCLVGMTSGLGTTEEMVSALDEEDLAVLFFALMGITG